jgi:predicted dehydrogenase
MATEKIRVGVIGANVRYGWGRDAHIPALSALPEFEITAVWTSRQETADGTANHFGIPHAFSDPYKMVQHPDVDLVSICVRVPFHHQLGMAALNAGKHLYSEWPLAATSQRHAGNQLGPGPCRTAKRSHRTTARIPETSHPFRAR